MDRDIARFVLLLVNDFEQYKRLQAVVEAKIKKHLENLEKTKDTTRIYEIQGAIAELRRWQHLKEEVQQAAE